MRSSKKWTRPVAAAAAAGLALSLAACSSSSSGGDTTPSASGSGGGDCSAPGVTADEVKVGIVFPATGPSAPTFAGYDLGAQAAVAAANAAGGVNGRKITLETYDDLGDGATQVTAATKAIQSDNNFSLMAASRVDTMYDFLKQNNVPVTGFPGQPPYANDLNAIGAWGAWGGQFFNTAYTDKFKAQGATNVAVLAHNSPGSLASANAFATVAKQQGLTIGMTQLDIPLGPFDATSTAVRMRDAGITGVYSPLLTDSAISIIQAMNQQGVKPKMGFYSGIYDPAVLEQSGALLDGAWTVPTAIKPLQLETPEIKTYTETLAKYEPTANPAQGFTPAGYLSGLLLVKGLEEAGDCLSRENFITATRKVTDYDGAGLIVAPVSFTPGITPDGDPLDCLWFVQIKNEEYVPDTDSVCGELVKVG